MSGGKRPNISITTKLKDAPKEERAEQIFVIWRHRQPDGTVRYSPKIADGVRIQLADKKTVLDSTTGTKESDRWLNFKDWDEGKREEPAPPSDDAGGSDPNDRLPFAPAEGWRT